MNDFTRGALLTREGRFNALARELHKLSDSQMFWLEKVIQQFRNPTNHWRNPESQLITECVLETFSDALLIHHAFSRGPLAKDTFEYTLERTLNLCGISATKEEACNPGHDITIRSEKFSLKTQADKRIAKKLIHISKFMELGGGKWESIKDYPGLREQFFDHMRSYERILQFRRIMNTVQLIEYELVEIPKTLLLTATSGTFEVAKKRRKATSVEFDTNAPSGYCHVYVANQPAAENEPAQIAFDLYFDGAGERKLQIRKLRHDLCTVHAIWRLQPNPAIKTLDPEVEESAEQP